MSKMWQICLLIWIIGITTVNTLRNRPGRPTELNTMNLVITAYQSLGDVYIDGQAKLLTNAGNWSLTDRVALAPMSRLIALEGMISNSEPCAGVLASVNDTYLLSNSLWKCSPYNDINWTQLGFDDSSWPSAVEYGTNGNHSTCGEDKHFDDISSNARWIWSIDTNAFGVYCRGYLPVCDSSPCQNNGTCLPNDVKMCDCQPQFIGTYCETDILATLKTTETTTVMTTQPHTTEGVTTSSMQTTEVTTLPQTTQGVTTTETTTLQTTESATTVAATTTAATTLTITTPTTTTPTTTTPITTPTTTTPTTTTPTTTTPTTTPTTTTPTTTTPTTTTPTTTTPATTTPTTTTPTTPSGSSTSTIYAGLVSSTNPGNPVSSDPPPIQTCTEDLYCNGPLEKPGASIEHCACPADYLNVNNNCCMSQNWIIGLACLSAGILIIIFIIIIACLCCKDHSDHSSMGESVDLVDRDHLAAEAHSMDHMTYVSETHMGNHKKPEGGIVDAHGVNAAHGATEDALHAKADAHHVPVTRRHSLGVNMLRGLNPSGEYPRSQHPIYTLAGRRGQPDYRSMIERGRREDFFYNPLMVELLSNDTYRQFRPTLGAIPTNVDYSIQRPEIELEFLYNELYGSDLHRGGIYDYRSPWNMDMNMRL